MSNPESTAEASQPSEAENVVGGMEALRNALKDSLSPQPEEAPETVEEPPVPEPEAVLEEQPEPESEQDDWFSEAHQSPDGPEKGAGRTIGAT